MADGLAVDRRVVDADDVRMLECQRPVSSVNGRRRVLGGTEEAPPLWWQRAPRSLKSLPAKLPFGEYSGGSLKRRRSRAQRPPSSGATGTSAGSCSKKKARKMLMRCH
jgi:hypothetical protein